MMLTKQGNGKPFPANHYQQKQKFNHESETENNKRLGV